MAILDRIKYNGTRNSSDWLIYKYPGESFVEGAQLIVGEGQVAVFVKGGQALDYFTPGTYQLSTSNLPLLKAFINLPFGFKTPYAAELYFINTTTKLDIAWGTMSPIQLVDPKYNVKLRIRAYGQFGMKIDDYRVVLTELIGTLKPQDIVNYSKILEYFKGILVMKANSLIAQAIIKNKVSALEISASIDEISQHCQKEIVKEFNRFGFKVINFYIQSINFPDEDFNDINLILKDKATFDIIGDKKYVTKRSFDTLDSAAKNESVSGAFAGAGLGVGLGAGLNSVVTKLNNNINTLSNNKKCSNCGTEYAEGTLFCSNCGHNLTENIIQCSSCNKYIDKNSKYCSYCGNPINMLICKKCKTPNPTGTKYCKECGTKLEDKK